jgi:hypothetical protein
MAGTKLIGTRLVTSTQNILISLKYNKFGSIFLPKNVRCYEVRRIQTESGIASNSKYEIKEASSKVCQDRTDSFGRPLIILRDRNSAKNFEYWTNW